MNVVSRYAVSLAVLAGVLCGTQAASSWPSGGLSPQGGAVTGVDATSGGGLVVTGTPARPSVGLLPSCSTNQILKWTGSAWACSAETTLPSDNVTGTVTVPDLIVATGPHVIGNYAGSSPSACSAGQAVTQVVLSAAGVVTQTCATAGITNSAGNFVVPKSNGTNLVASSISDTGSAVQITNATSIQNTLFVQDFRGTVQASTVVGTQNDFGISSTATILRWSGASNATFTGFTGGADGRILVVENTTSSSIVLSAESGSSAAANRLWLSGPSNQIVLASPASNPNSFATFVYDGTASRWRMQSYNSQRVDVGMEWVQASQFDGALGVTGVLTASGNLVSNAGSINTLGHLRLGTITPSLTGGATVNDWNPSGLVDAVTIFASCPSATCTITGMIGGANGRIVTIYNTGAGEIDLPNANVGSAAANRWNTTYSTVALVGNLGCSASFVYSTADSFWHQTAFTCGSVLYNGTTNLTANTLPKASSSNVLQNSLLTDDGTTFRVNSTFFTVTEANGNTASLGFGDFKSGLYGGNGSTADTVYATQDRLGYAYNTNGAATGHINSVGYQEGTTQPRSLEINDGQGTGAGHFFAFFDAVANAVTLGKSTATAISFSNGPAGVNLYSGQHLEWADDFLYGISGSIVTGTNLGQFWKLIQAGTGVTIAQNAGVAGRPGIVSFDTASGTSGNDVLLTTGESIEFADGNYSFEIALEWPTLSSSSNSVASMYASELGFADTASINQQDGCYFAYDKGNNLAGSINAGNVDALECWCASNNTRTGYLINATGNSDNAFPLGTGTVAAGTWYRLKIAMTSTNKAEFYRNGTKVCEIATNIPSTSLRQTAVQIGHYPLASTGTGSRTMLVDQATFKVDLASPRSP